MPDGTKTQKPSGTWQSNPIANASANEQSQCTAANQPDKKRTISHNPHAKYSYVEKGELLSVKPTSITGFIARWHATAGRLCMQCFMLCCSRGYIRFRVL